VFNVAVFYFFALHAFRRDMIAALSFFDKAQTDTTGGFDVVVREFSQSHFAGRDDGLYWRPATPECEPLSGAGVGFAAYTKIVTDLLVECREKGFLTRRGRQPDGGTSDAPVGDAAGDDSDDATVAMTTRCARISFLPVADALRSEHAAHVGMHVHAPHQRSGDGAFTYDCQHWCAPSAPLHHWTELLDNFVCNTSDESDAVE
jgi:hypothetical protein